MRLRAVEIDDIDLIFKWENDENLWYITETQRPFSKEAIRNYVETTQNEDIYSAKQLRLMIEVEKEKGAVGCVDLFDYEPQNRRAGIGIVIDKAYLRKGYGLLSLQMLKNYAFNVLSIHNLYAFVPQNNEASCRLCEKANFNKTAVLQDWIFRNRKYENIIVYQCFDISIR
ncbi:MAG: GNAT family N-acetyltransferase [Bacteroidales bacterium]|nr:GNAT family N-acetyltransferase [Bacteroidales bacterium]